MNAWIRANRSIVAAVAWILFANVLIGMAVWFNRSGDPVTEISLTNRELGSPGWDRHNGESSSIELRLNWENRLGLQSPSAESRFIDREMLKALGFDVSRSADTERGRRFYERMLPREAIYVFTYNPDAPVGEFGDSPRRPFPTSRLQLVDLAGNIETLRERYAIADQEYLFLRGKVRVFVDSDAEPYGAIVGPNLDYVTLPRVFRDAFLEADSSYSIRLAIGRNLVPWVKSFEQR
ncbi:MAG: DUF4824 family protein [Opitutales bacterium]|nr:DUF4824 family protein [Opitutales bacterium]